MSVGNQNISLYLPRLYRTRIWH